MRIITEYYRKVKKLKVCEDSQLFWMSHGKKLKVAHGPARWNWGSLTFVRLRNTDFSLRPMLYVSGFVYSYNSNKRTLDCSKQKQMQGTLSTFGDKYTFTKMHVKK